MAQCALLEKCIFFNDKMVSMPVTSEMMKKKYCLKDNTHCARYMICSTLGKEYVPTDLFPNRVDKATEILASKEKSGAK